MSLSVISAKQLRYQNGLMGGGGVPVAQRGDVSMAHQQVASQLSSHTKIFSANFISTHFSP